LPHGRGMQPRAMLPLPANGGVDGNPVQPSVKQRVSLEAAQVLVGVEKGLLNHVLGILRTVKKPKDGVEQSILIPADEIAESRRATFQAFRNQPLLVAAHGFFLLIRRPEGALSSQKIRQVAPRCNQSCHEVPKLSKQPRRKSRKLHSLLC